MIYVPAKPVPEDQAVMVLGPWYCEVSPSMEASPMPDGVHGRSVEIVAWRC